MARLAQLAQQQAHGGVQLALLRVALERGEGERHRAQRLALCAHGRPLCHPLCHFSTL